MQNIHRLGFVGLTLANHRIIAILCAINPYKESRMALRKSSPLTRTVYIECPIDILRQRDPKDLYRKALLPESHPDHIPHFTGISDPYEVPVNPDLVIQTQTAAPEQSAKVLTDYIIKIISE